MKAVVLEAFGDTSHLKLKEMPIPQPKKGEVRIHIHAVGFNPVDFKLRKNMYGGAAVPLILGADCSGVIDAVGPDVTEFSKGDEVFALAFGQCSNGSYAEYLSLPVEFIAKKPKNLSFEEAAVLPIAGLTAYRCLLAPSAIKKGDTIFIANSGGGVGSMAIQFAKYQQARAIFTVARNAESAQFMQKKLGIHPEHIAIYEGHTTEELEQKLLAMNGGRLFDATFDFVGGDMKKLCLELTAHSGHFSTPVGEDDKFFFPVWHRAVSLPFQRCLSLHTIFIGAEAFSGPRSSWSIYAKQLGLISELMEKKAITPPPIHVLGSLSLATIKEAHHLLEGLHVKGKLVMTVPQ